MHDLFYQIHIWASYAKGTICFFLSYSSILGLLLMYFDRGNRR